MESGKATPINEAIADALRGSQESQPLLEDSSENKSYKATDDTARSQEKAMPTEGTYDDQKFQIQFNKAQDRYLTVELPVALTTLVFQMLNTFETEYIHERISADLNYNASDENKSHCINISSHDAKIEAQIQSDVSTWLFYLGLAYALPSKWISAYVQGLIMLIEVHIW